MKSLIKQIDQVRFRRVSHVTKHGFEEVSPQALDDRHLAMKVRYHMKHSLACLLEMKRRKLDVCKVLSKALFEYNQCSIRHDDYSIKMFMKITGDKDEKSKKSK